MPRPVDELVARMEAMLEPLVDSGDARRFFHATYLRTTKSVAAEIDRGGFLDGDWTERRDVALWACTWTPAKRGPEASPRPSPGA